MGRVTRLATLAIAAATLAAPTAGAAEIELKLSHFLPTASGIHRDFMEPWARQVETCSGGRVAIEIFPAGTQLGIVVVTVAEVGLITPPVGRNLFVVQAVMPGLRAETVIRGIVPFVLADIVRLAVLVAFPALVLWLPGRMGP